MILEAIRQNPTILNNLKIYITSKPLLKLGCQFIGVALIIYLIARFGGPTVITLVFLTYICVKKITEKTSIRGDSDKGISKEKFDRLKKENEYYITERTQILQKMSPLKNDNKNLHSQIERQTCYSDNLLHEIEQRKLEQNKVAHEKKLISDELAIEKKRRKTECHKLESRLEEMECRYRSEFKQFQNEIFELNMKNEMYKDDYTTMSERLKAAVNEKKIIERKCQASMADIEKERLTHIRFKEDSTKKLQQYENKIIKYQCSMTSVANANRALEESKKEINSQKVEIEHLKLRLEQAPRESHVPVCTICEDREINIVIAPCGHTMCLVCATEVMSRNSKCPVCRAHITKKSNIYFS